MNREKTKLKFGYTTGTCAAAAAKAAALLIFKEERPTVVTIDLPGGDTAKLPIHSLKKEGNTARASVIKNAGDDPDVTHGLEIWAEVSTAEYGIKITGGKGVGLVTKPGLSVPVGEHAINPVPRQMITSEVEKILDYSQGAQVVISVPKGEETAPKTMNNRLGIVGGISILGTSGIVRPMSETALRQSLIPQLDVALAQGYDYLVLTPGRMGVKRALAMNIHNDSIVETSNFIGAMLEESVNRQVKGAIILGHLGKLVKLAGGIFHTYSKLADARREIITAHAALNGADKNMVQQLMQLNTAEQSVELLNKNNMKEIVFNSIATAAEERCRSYCSSKIKIGVVIYSMTGEVLASTETAKKIGGKQGWQIP
ncbi:MAG: cobalamin biosynthesis protein CbiD [Firmicutes bacterium]|nr:cobalamin biosynthesis protein CbiD [Bacillota bacterium]